MPFRVDDPFAWSENMPDDIQQQIAGELGAPSAELDFGGLKPSDIGESGFDASDLLSLGLSALSSANFNAGTVGTFNSLTAWGLRQLPNIVGIEMVGELGIGFGAEAVGDDGGDLADLNTRNPFGSMDFTDF